MASLTRRTWVWVSSRSWWWIGKPGMLQSMGSQSQTQLSDWTEPRVKPKSSLLPARPYEIQGCCLLTLFPHSPLAAKSHLQSFGTHKLESTQELLQLLTSLLKSFSPNSSPDVKWRGLLPLSFFLFAFTSNAGSTAPIDLRSGSRWGAERHSAAQLHSTKAKSSSHERKRERCYHVLVSRLTGVEWGCYTRGNDQPKIRRDLHNASRKGKVDRSSTKVLSSLRYFRL